MSLETAAAAAAAAAASTAATTTDSDAETNAHWDDLSDARTMMDRYLPTQTRRNDVSSLVRLYDVVDERPVLVKPSSSLSLDFFDVFRDTGHTYAIDRCGEPVFPLILDIDCIPCKRGAVCGGANRDKLVTLINGCLKRLLNRPQPLAFAVYQREKCGTSTHIYYLDVFVTNASYGTLVPRLAAHIAELKDVLLDAPTCLPLPYTRVFARDDASEGEGGTNERDRWLLRRNTSCTSGQSPHVIWPVPSGVTFYDVEFIFKDYLRVSNEYEAVGILTPTENASRVARTTDSFVRKNVRERAKRLFEMKYGKRTNGVDYPVPMEEGEDNDEDDVRENSSGELEDDDDEDDDTFGSLDVGPRCSRDNVECRWDGENDDDDGGGGVGPASKRPRHDDDGIDVVCAYHREQRLLRKRRQKRKGRSSLRVDTNQRHRNTGGNLTVYVSLSIRASEWVSGDVYIDNIKTTHAFNNMKIEATKSSFEGFATFVNKKVAVPSHLTSKDTDGERWCSLDVQEDPYEYILCSVGEQIADLYTGTHVPEPDGSSASSSCSTSSTNNTAASDTKSIIRRLLEMSQGGFSFHVQACMAIVTMRTAAHLTSDEAYNWSQSVRAMNRVMRRVFGDQAVDFLKDGVELEQIKDVSALDDLYNRSARDTIMYMIKYEKEPPITTKHNRIHLLFNAASDMDHLDSIVAGILERTLIKGVDGNIPGVYLVYDHELGIYVEPKRSFLDLVETEYTLRASKLGGSKQTANNPRLMFQCLVKKMTESTIKISTWGYYSFCIATEYGLFNTLTGRYMSGVPQITFKRTMMHVVTPLMCDMSGGEIVKRKGDVQLKQLNEQVTIETCHTVDMVRSVLGDWVQLFILTVFLPGSLSLLQAPCIDADTANMIFNKVRLFVTCEYDNNEPAKQAELAKQIFCLKEVTARVKTLRFDHFAQCMLVIARIFRNNRTTDFSYRALSAQAALLTEEELRHPPVSAWARDQSLHAVFETVSRQCRTRFYKRYERYFDASAFPADSVDVLKYPMYWFNAFLFMILSIGDYTSEFGSLVASTVVDVLPCPAQAMMAASSGGRVAATTEVLAASVTAMTTSTTATTTTSASSSSSSSSSEALRGGRPDNRNTTTFSSFFGGGRKSLERVTATVGVGNQQQQRLQSPMTGPSSSSSSSTTTSSSTGPISVVPGEMHFKWAFDYVTRNRFGQLKTGPYVDLIFFFIQLWNWEKEMFADFLQDAAHLYQTAHTRKPIIALQGGKKSGKSTLCRIIEKAHRNCYFSKANEFTQPKNDGGPQSELIHMLNARVVLIKECVRLPAQLLKQATGGDAIQAQNKYNKDMDYLDPKPLIITTTNSSNIKVLQPDTPFFDRLRPYHCSSTFSTVVACTGGALACFVSGASLARRVDEQTLSRAFLNTVYAAFRMCDKNDAGDIIPLYHSKRVTYIRDRIMAKNDGMWNVLNEAGIYLHDDSRIALTDVERYVSPVIMHRKNRRQMEMNFKTTFSRESNLKFYPTVEQFMNEFKAYFINSQIGTNVYSGLKYTGQNEEDLVRELELRPGVSRDNTRALGQLLSRYDIQFYPTHGDDDNEGVVGAGGSSDDNCAAAAGRNAVTTMVALKRMVAVATTIKGDGYSDETINTICRHLLYKYNDRRNAKGDLVGVAKIV